MILPAAWAPSSPWRSISLVDAIFSDSLKSVVIRRTEGKTEKSSGLRVYIPMKRIRSETDMLSVRNMSARKAFRGTIMISITKTTLMATMTSPLSRI
jgi:hypothetical protein